MRDAGVKINKGACPLKRGLLRVALEPIRREEGVVLETTKTATKGDKHMKTTDKYIGLDVHKDSITVAIAEGVRLGEVRQYGKISNDLHSLEKLLPRLGGEKVRLHFVYEAGPTGFVIHRWLRKREIDSIVIAPTKTPQEKGPRQKTDRREAEQLARLHRAGELKAIHVPDELDEAIRDLTRARSDAVDDLRRAKQRLKAFLLRHGYRYSGRADWSEAHRRYLRDGARQREDGAARSAAQGEVSGCPLGSAPNNWFCPWPRKRPCSKKASWRSTTRPHDSTGSTS